MPGKIWRLKKSHWWVDVLGYLLCGVINSVYLFLQANGQAAMGQYTGEDAASNAAKGSLFVANHAY